MFNGANNREVRVEPTRSHAGVVWQVIYGGVVSRHNYKKDAVSKGRQKGRAEGTVLKVFNKDMSLSKTVDYR